MQLGEVPSTNSGRAERQSAPLLRSAAAAVSLSAPVSKVTFSTEWTGNRLADFDRVFPAASKPTRQRPRPAPQQE